MSDETLSKGDKPGQCPHHQQTGGNDSQLHPDAVRISALIDAHGDDHHDELDHAVATVNSNYSGPLQPSHDEIAKGERGLPVALYQLRRNELWPTKEDDHADTIAQVAHDQLRAHILGPYFPCVGARATWSHCTYRYGFYKDLGHASSAAAMGRDLRRFISEYQELGDFCSFTAQFKYPQSTSEGEFEAKLFEHLQLLHDFDKSEWDPHYSADPDSQDFAFSFAGAAFFIVGMHPGSSRLSRRVSYPTLIFNPESQVRRLKEHGQLTRFAETVRKRDTRLQGYINPSLPADVNSTGGEANVYSGQAHPPGTPWKNPLKIRGQCPFHQVKATDKK